MKTQHIFPWRRKALAVAVASCFAITPAYANPTGASVINGQVDISQQGSVLSITNSPGAIINWQGFSIGVNELTRFLQQSASSSVLNRVVGQDPSSILGTLQSNGRVFLINPNGVLFGQGAVVDVAGLVTSTLNLSDADFLAGKLNFSAVSGAGNIVNQGSITTPTGGQVYLVAPNVENSGIITSPQGDIILAAGNSVELVDSGTPNLRVVMTAPDGQAVNLGQIVAQSGRVGIYAGLIHQGGTVNADTAVVGANGQIMFMASKDIVLDTGSVTSASGAQGGAHDGGEVRIIADGKLDMRQGSQVHVDGGADGGNGGFLELSGKTGFSLRGLYTGRAQKAGYHNGSLLLDPTNINIVGTGTDTLSGSGSSGSLFASSGSGSYNVAPSALNGWMNVSLTALNDISVQSAIGNGDVNNGSSGGSLTLNAGNNITIGAAIGTSASSFMHDLTFNASNNININNSIYLGNNTLTLAANTAIPSFGVPSGTGSILVDPLASLNTLSAINASAAGNITLGDVNAASVSATSTGGNILSNSGSGVIQTSSLTLDAAGGIGVGGALRTNLGGTGTLDFITHGANAAGNVTIVDSGILSSSQIGNNFVAMSGSGTKTISFTGSSIVVDTDVDTSTIPLTPTGGPSAGPVNLTLIANSGTITRVDQINPSPRTSFVKANDVRLEATAGIGTASTPIVANAANNLAARTTTSGNIALDLGSGSTNIGTADGLNGIINAGTGNVTLTTTGTVTQTQAIAAGGLELLGSGGTYNLDTVNNAVTTLAGNTGTVKFKDNTGFAIGTVNSTGLTASGSVTLNSTGTVTQTQAITAGGLELLGSGGTHNLDTVNNAVTTLAGNTGTVKFKDDTGFAIGTVNSTAGLTASGNVTLKSNNAVTQTQALVAAGLELLNGTFTLTNVGNSVGTLAAANLGGALQFSNAGAFSVGTVGSTTGVSSGQAVTLVAGAGATPGTGNLTIAENIDAGAGAVNLTTAAGSGGNIGSSTGTVKTTGLLTLNAHGGVGIVSALNTDLGGTGTVDFSTHGNDAAGNVTIEDIGTLNLSQINNVQLLGTGSGAQTISLTGASLVIDSDADANQITTSGTGPINFAFAASTGDITRTGNFTVTANDLSLSAATGIGTGAAPLQVVAGSNLAAQNTTGDILLNVGVGPINIGTANGLNGINAGTGNVTLTSSGTVTQSQAITASGLELTGATGTYNLDAANNAVTTLAGNTGTVKFKDNSGFAIGTVNSTGLTASSNVTLNSTGTVTQSQAITASGLELLGSGGTHNLDTVNNSVTTLAGNTGNVKFRDDTGFAIGTVNSTAGLTASGNVTLNSTGTVTQSQALVAAGLELLNGTFTLNGNNSVGVLSAANLGGALQFTNAGAFSVGSVNSTIGISSGHAVTLTANAGNLTVAENIAAGTTLNLSAANNVIVNSDISSAAGALNVTLRSDSDANGVGNIQMNTGSSIVSNGGDIVMGGGSGVTLTDAIGSGTATSADASGIYLDGATLNAGAGNINLKGAGVAGTNCVTEGIVCGANGIYATGGSIIQTTTGTITLNGTGGVGTNYNSGVRLGSNSQITSANSAISITGQGAGTGTNNYGVYVHNNATISADGAGTITLDGTGGAGTNYNYGVRLSSGMQITSVDGDISITGHGAGTGAENYGIIHTGTSYSGGLNAAITSNGLANITLDGTGTAGAEGISLAGAVNANHDLTLKGSSLLLPANNYTLTAGNDLNLLADIGSAAQRFGHDLTLQAGNDVNVSSSIFLGNNTLTLAADTDNAGGGEVFIRPPLLWDGYYYTVPVTIDTQGDLAVSGAGMQVLGYNFGPWTCGWWGCSYPQVDAAVTVNVGGAFTANVGHDMWIEAGYGRYGVDHSVRLNALGNIDITAGSLTVRGGEAYDNESDNSGSYVTRADAVLQGADVSITTTAGGLTVQGGRATAYASYGTESGLSVTASANAKLAASGTMTIDTGTGGVTVQGGNGASASASGVGSNTATATANAAMTANNMELTVAGPVTVQGGSYASASASYGQSSQSRNIATAEVNATLHADQNLTLTVTSGDVTVAGGYGASASASEGYGVESVTASANGEISAGGSLEITVEAGSLAVAGGNGASASASASSGLAQVTATANADGKLISDGDMTLTVSGALTVQGGSNASASANGTSGAPTVNATASAQAQVSAGGALKIGTDTDPVSSLTVAGGNWAYARASGSGNNTASANADASITANSVELSVSGMTSIDAGSSADTHAHGSLNAAANNYAAADANAQIAAGTSLVLNSGGLELRGGGLDPAYADGLGSNSAISNSNALLVSSGSLTVDAGYLGMWGGSAARATTGNGNNYALANAGAAIVAAGDATLNTNTDGETSGNVYIYGGGFESSFAEANAIAGGTAVADASAIIAAGGNKTLNIAGSLLLQGGGVDQYGSGATAIALAMLDPGSLTVTTGGDVMLISGYTPGTGTMLSSSGPMTLNIGGSLYMYGGLGSGISPNYNTAGSPITITFTNGGAVSQNFSASFLANATITSDLPATTSAFDESLLNPFINETNDTSGVGGNQFASNQEADFINAITEANPPGAGEEGDSNLPPWMRRKKLGACS